MRNSAKILLLTAIFVALTFMSPYACTNLLVTKGASADGSVMITYTCDGEFHPHMGYEPAADYPPGDSLKIEDWLGNARGYIKQVPHTYAVVDMMNEHQLAISETTFDGREELQNKQGMLGYWDLIDLALRRAKTAREAIKVMIDLAEEYGYRSTGESISIADPNEAWILEIIGPGDGGKGAVWVAVKVPDGYISCHANKARIGTFPTDDPENCLYSKNVKSFAVEKGYYNPDSGEPFRFCEAYCPATPKNQRWADGRVWSILRRAAPSQNFSPDYYRAVSGAEPYPLWIRPDKKLSLSDVTALMRDHFEDTEWDMTKGVDAGPYGLPYRWRPLDWKVTDETGDSVEYAWERAVSTQQTGFTFISQSRSWLPNPIGGVYWYGLDDTWFTCYTPMYCGIDAIPYSFTVGSLQKFSWESAWWVFNFVSNIAGLKYSFMIEDIQKVQSEIEGEYIALQPAVEKTAMELYQTDPALMTKYLTDYCVSHAESMVDKWRALGEHLLTKYNDGYVKDSIGEPQNAGYPESWLRAVLRENPEQYRLPVLDTAKAESRLVD